MKDIYMEKNIVADGFRRKKIRKPAQPTLCRGFFIHCSGCLCFPLFHCKPLRPAPNRRRRRCRAMAAPFSFRYIDAVREAAMESPNLAALKEAEAASGMDLKRFSGCKGRNLLHHAVAGAHATGRLGVCRYLVEEKGFDANSISDDGETTIFVATETPVMEYGPVPRPAGVVPLLNYFLARGVDPAAPDARGCMPLHNVAAAGHIEAILLLLSRGVPVDPCNHNGTPLLLAAKNGHAEAVKILLQHGADPNKVVHRVYSPLVMACLRARSLECVKLLVEAGADVNFQPARMTMALVAVGSGSTDIVKFLLDAGADPNIHDGFGRYPIMQAAYNEQHELVKILLPRTNPIPSLPDWSVGGIISTMKIMPQEMFVESFAHAMSEGREAFANGDYGYAIYCFTRASSVDPDDATVYANMSLCSLKQREAIPAVVHAKQCQRLRPRWAKGWYREGAAVCLLQKYRTAVPVLQRALELDPANVEIKNKLREAEEALRKKYHDLS